MFLALFGIFWHHIQILFFAVTQWNNNKFVFRSDSVRQTIVREKNQFLCGRWLTNWKKAKKQTSFHIWILPTIRRVFKYRIICHTLHKIPEYLPKIPLYFPKIPPYLPKVPPYMPKIPQYLPQIPQYFPQIPQYLLKIPQH